jgi:hypothetical protein
MVQLVNLIERREHFSSQWADHFAVLSQLDCCGDCDGKFGDRRIVEGCLFHGAKAD